MFHCDQLEKFTTYAEARFVQPAAAQEPQQVRRVQYTLDVATHPTPGRWYELVKDPDTGVEIFVRATPKPRAPAPAVPPPEQAGVASAAPAPEAAPDVPPTQ